MRRACHWWSLLPILAALALIGCSGEGSSGLEVLTAPAPPPVEVAADYATAADRLCVAAQVEQEIARRERGGDQLTLDDRARLLVELAPSRVRLAEELALLGPATVDDDAALALVAAARRRGAASSRAGELWERGAAEARIASAAAQEHDQRVRFVEIAADLGLRDCAEVLPPAQRRLVRATLERGLTESDPSERCAAFGERLLEQEYGGGQGSCAASDPRTPIAERISVERLDGMDEVFAVAQITAEGGNAPGVYRARIAFEDGAYRIDKLD